MDKVPQGSTRYHKVDDTTAMFCFLYCKVGENAKINKGNKEWNLNDYTL